MEYEFLKRLYYSAAGPGTPREGRRLQEVYEQTQELAQAWREINTALGAAAESDAVSNALNQLWEASELQGFINGFRLCAQMRRELGSGAGLKYDKTMAGGNLENIMTRLICCCALLDAVRWAMDSGSNIEDALYGATDQLRNICRDFQADIDAAKDYTGEEAQA